MRRRQETLRFFRHSAFCRSQSVPRRPWPSWFSAHAGCLPGRRRPAPPSASRGNGPPSQAAWVRWSRLRCCPRLTWSFSQRSLPAIASYRCRFRFSTEVRATLLHGTSLKPHLDLADIDDIALRQPRLGDARAVDEHAVAVLAGEVRDHHDPIGRAADDGVIAVHSSNGKAQVVVLFPADSNKRAPDDAAAAGKSLCLDPSLCRPRRNVRLLG